MSKLREWRKRRRLSQEELVAATGISRSTYQRLENGQIDNPPLRYLVNCALALHCEPADLFEPEWLEWKVFDAAKKEPPEFGTMKRKPSWED